MPVAAFQGSAATNNSRSRVGPEGDTRNPGAEIDLNYEIDKLAGKTGITHLLD